MYIGASLTMTEYHLPNSEVYRTVFPKAKVGTAGQIYLYQGYTKEGKFEKSFHTNTLPSLLSTGTESSTGC